MPVYTHIDSFLPSTICTFRVQRREPSTVLAASFIWASVSLERLCLATCHFFLPSLGHLPSSGLRLFFLLLWSRLCAGFLIPRPTYWALQPGACVVCSSLPGSPSSTIPHTVINHVFRLIFSSHPLFAYAPYYRHRTSSTGGVLHTAGMVLFLLSLLFLLALYDAVSYLNLSAARLPHTYTQHALYMLAHIHHNFHSIRLLCLGLVRDYLVCTLL